MVTTLVNMLPRESNIHKFNRVIKVTVLHLLTAFAIPEVNMRIQRKLDLKQFSFVAGN
jgi:hypothetical protein